MFQWVLVNAVGWAVGSTVRRLAFGIASATLGFASGRIVEGAVIGAAVGIAQILVLPQPFSRSGWWVLASIIAWAVGWFGGWSLGWSVFGTLGLRTVFVVIGATAGLVGGIIQWTVLRAQLPRSGWWVLTSTVGWAVGLGLAVTAGRALGWLVAGAMGGAITGLPMALFWRGSTSAP